jgi:hypothetical protein
MTRLHADPVEVQHRDTRLGPEPAQFLWRGRLYVVREVLARWTESGGWWRSDAVRALLTGDTTAVSGPGRDPLGPGGPGPGSDGSGGDGSGVGGSGVGGSGALETVPIPASPRWAQRAWGEPAPDIGAAAGPAGIDDRERTWWRVEAGAGRAAGSGVYDLSHDVTSGSWSLARVLD